jgi:hypothetical protein
VCMRVWLIPASRNFCLSPCSCSVSEPYDSPGVSVFAPVVLSGSEGSGSASLSEDLRRVLLLVLSDVSTSV